jgi:tRNA acetyltransferase TAN1
MQEFNFLVTTVRGFENRASAELRELLAPLKTEVKIGKAEPGGIILVNCKVAENEFLEKIQQTIKMQPWLLNNVQRIMPIQKNVRTDLDLIGEAVKELSKVIPKGESFRITVERRHTNIPGPEIIKETATHISRKVDLDNPDWVVLIEIVGSVTGVSVIKPEAILSTTKFRREL